MEYVGEHLTVTLVPGITGKIFADQPVADGDEGRVLAVGHGRYALNKKGMAGIKINAVIGVLPSLGHADAGFDLTIVETEGVTNLQWPAHLLYHGDIG